MRREKLPLDEITNSDRMLGIVIVGLAAACGIFTLLKLCAWVLG